jgi:magnesium-protoporphyrin IX monomethyl ester (oxidative) cyclase
MSLRRFESAIEDLEHARRGWEKRGEAAAEAQQLAALCDVHRWQGDLTAAIDCHQGLMVLESTEGVTVREAGGLLYTGRDDRSTWADKDADRTDPGSAQANGVAATHGHLSETDQRPLILFTPPCVGTFGPLFPRGAVALASFLNARGVPTIVVPLSHYVDLTRGARRAGDRLVSVVQEAVKSLRPRAVGISVMFSYLYPQGLDIAAAVAEVDPDLPLLIGGPHVTYWDRECLEEAPYVDVVIRGEGEWTLLELMEALERGGELSEIRGITWRAADGELHRNQLRSLGNVLELPEIDFGVLPPAFAGEMEVFGLSSRGCEFRCKYCHEFRYWGGSVRQYPAQRIVSEMERLWTDHGNPMRGIDDSMLNMLQPYFIDLMDQLGRSPHLPQPFGLLTRVDTISSEGLDAMTRAGIRSVSVGMESGSQKVLDVMNKEVTLERALQGLTLTREAGLDMSCFFIVGHPGDNPTEAETTRRFVERLFEERLTHWIDAAMFTPYPGTPFFSKPERHGVKILTMDWTRWRRTNRPICELDEFSANEVYLAYLRMLRAESEAAAGEPQGLPTPG